MSDQVQISREGVGQLLAKVLEAVRGEDASVSAAALVLATFAVIKGRIPTDGDEMQEVLSYFPSLFLMWQGKTVFH